MPASRFLQRRRAAPRRASSPQDRTYTDAQGRSALLRDDLARIDAILERLRDRRRIAPDMSSDDLLELFREERERVVAQLQAVDAALVA